MRTHDEILDELVKRFDGAPNPGDTSHATVSWGVEVMAEIHYDDVPASQHINDCDVWGKVSEFAYRYVNGESRTLRPEGFTGAARKLQVAQGYWMWWEPWDGFLKLSPEDQRKGQEQVRWLLEMGYVGVSLKLRESLTDSHGNTHWVDVEQEGLWGIEPFEGTDYLREILSQLLHELLHEEVKT